tara:strand:+ start:316 stop:1032 length:717 start_codon:yes stop_codon:yes gene_type:complete
MSDMIMKQPDGGYHVADASNLTKKDWHKTIRASDGTIPEEDIKKYYDIAMKLDWQDGWYSSDEMKKEAKTPGYKHIHLGGSDTSREEYEIEQDWVKEIWEQVNPGMKLLRHYLNGHHKGQSGGIHIDGWTADQYTAILYLTPGWEPEDGGTLELWTPNLNDEQKAMAISTPYGLNGDPSKNIIKSYWPRAGRVVLFDARIPHVARSVETDKFRVSLVFKGTTQGYQSEEPVKPSKVGV